MLKSLVSWSCVLLFVFAIRSAIAEPYVVPSGSMEPNIVPGDRIIVNKMAYSLKIPFTDRILVNFSQPKRGDVVVFKYPKNPSVNFVKRLIGLPGEKISIQDGKIFVNDNPIKIIENSDFNYEKIISFGGQYDENYGDKIVKIKRNSHIPDDQILNYYVPKDEYFFMGDNRDMSNDSRSWGFVPVKNIKGKALGVWSSYTWDNVFPTVRFERFGVVL